MNIQNSLDFYSRLEDLTGYVASHLYRYLHQKQGDSNISYGHAIETLEAAIANCGSGYGLMPVLERQLSSEELYKRYKEYVNPLIYQEVANIQRAAADTSIGLFEDAEPEPDMFEIIQRCAKNALHNAVQDLYDALVREKDKDLEKENGSL